MLAERPPVVALAGRWRRLLALPMFELAWAFPAWVMLGIGRVLVLTVSFRRLAPMLGVHAGVQPWLPLADARQQSRALMIGRLVRRSARFTPWQSNCFNQAITARLLLGLYRVPYVLFFGTVVEIDAQGRTGLSAHAWVASGRVAVTGGGGSFECFTVVSCFVDRSLAALMSGQLWLDAG